jgi:glycosyltransferase involved in cell wall biosynthesis
VRSVRAGESVKILYHHRTLADGAEVIHIMAMVSAFRSLGHEVRLEGLTTDPAHTRRRRIIEGVRSALPPAAFELATIASNAPDYFHLVRQIRAYEPDLLYTRHSRAGVAALLASRRLKIPSVLEINALFADPGYLQFEALAFPRLVKRLERRAAGLATVVVTVSSPLARRVRALTTANVIVLPNGADPVTFDPDVRDGTAIRSKYGLVDRLTIGWAGILREWHGLDLLLEALVHLPSASLLIVGDGPARRDLERRATEMGLRDRLVITGRVPHTEMADYIAAMDVAVVVNERTGIASPMKLLEYMAMARAVVAPRIENIEDVIDDGVNGILFSPGDAGDLAARLQELAADGASRQRLGGNARADVRVTRNWRAIAQRVLVAVAECRDDPDPRQNTTG